MDKAMSLFQAAVRAGRWQAWRGVAEVHRRNDHLEAAAHAFSELLRADPDDFPARLEYGRLLSWTGRRDAAKAQLSRVVAEASDADLLAAARRALADNRAWNGEHHDAWPAYRTLIGERPDDTELRLALGDLELWRGRPGHARQHYLTALDRLPTSERGREGLEDAEARLLPRLVLQVQFFHDNSGWSRLKTLTGAEFSPAADAYPDWRTFLGSEYASFRQRDGTDLERESVVTRQILRPDPFTELHLDFELGEHRDEASLRGGVDARRELAADTWAWAGWRHDDFIDAHAPYPFDRYNQAQTVDIARGDVLQAESFQIGATYDPASGAGVLGNLVTGGVEDGNFRRELYLQGHHRSLSGAQSLAWRGFFHYIDFSDAAVGYYSPSGRDSIGGGWRWERDEDAWQAFADVALFWESAALDGVGWQLSGGWQATWEPGAVAGIELNLLSTDEGRLGDDRYTAYAVLVHVTCDF